MKKMSLGIPFPNLKLFAWSSLYILLNVLLCCFSMTGCGFESRCSHFCFTIFWNLSIWSFLRLKSFPDFRFIHFHTKLFLILEPNLFIKLVQETTPKQWHRNSNHIWFLVFTNLVFSSLPGVRFWQTILRLSKFFIPKSFISVNVFKPKYLVKFRTSFRFVVPKDRLLKVKCQHQQIWWDNVTSAYIF